MRGNLYHVGGIFKPMASDDDKVLQRNNNSRRVGFDSRQLNLSGHERSIRGSSRSHLPNYCE